MGQLVDAARSVGQHAADGDVAHVVPSRVRDFVQCAGQQLQRLVPGEPPRLPVPPVVGVQELIHPAEGHGVPPLPDKSGMRQPQKLERLAEGLRRVSGDLMAGPRHGGQAVPAVGRSGLSQAVGRVPVLADERAEGGHGDVRGPQKILPVRRVRAALVRRHGALDFLQRPRHPVPQEAGVIRGEMVGVGGKRAGAIALNDLPRPPQIRRGRLFGEQPPQGAGHHVVGIDMLVAAGEQALDGVGPGNGRRIVKMRRQALRVQNVGDPRRVRGRGRCLPLKCFQSLHTSRPFPFQYSKIRCKW